ncbi:hypothetical protein TeGR_g4359 [Tetraparma gracilis]|uniref:Uncharacterized protein n=1 Tax=Tetraparma gracilis TaxID=2962635 RepID=A0ABQ6N9C1_9STRA|nr:hypothetical protein TeGR_g4359 [Tetraparma gracilis]
MIFGQADVQGQVSLEVREGNNIEIWWKFFNYMHDRIKYEVVYFHGAVNVMTAVMVLNTLGAIYLSWSPIEVTSTRFNLFVVLVAFSALHFVYLAVLLRLVVAINMESDKITSDINDIIFCTRDELLDSSLNASQTRKRNLEELIHKLENFVRDLDARPRMVGRLMGKRVTTEMVAKGGGAVLVALFSSVVRQGMND